MSEDEIDCEVLRMLSIGFIPFEVARELRLPMDRVLQVIVRVNNE